MSRLLFYARWRGVLTAKGDSALGHDAELDSTVRYDSGEVAVGESASEAERCLRNALALRAHGSALSRDGKDGLDELWIYIVWYPLHFDVDVGGEGSVEQHARAEAVRDLAAELGQDLRISERGEALVFLPPGRDGKNSMHG